MVKLASHLKTGFHRTLANADWLSLLAQFLSERIAQHKAYRTSSGRGCVRSLYNDEKYMGPNSVCRYEFAVKVSVSRGRFSLVRDRYEADVRYVPEDHRFEIRWETIRTVETWIRDLANFLLVRRMVRRIRSGRISSEEAGGLLCPWCGARARVDFSPDGRCFSLSCSYTTYTGHFHATSETDSPPGWWEDCISNDWLDRPVRAERGRSPTSS